MTAGTHRNEAGFTLLELLVSLTLLSLLFVLLFGSLRFGMRAWERGDSIGAATDTMRAAQALIRDEVERVCPRRGAGEPPLIDFSGARGTLHFLATAPQAAGGRNCADLALSVQRDGSLYQLVLSLKGEPGTVLLARAQDISFSYFGRNSGGWRDDWQGAAALPDLVRLRIVFPAGDARAWPELFVAPRVSAEADCTYDAGTQSCRGQ